MVYIVSTLITLACACFAQEIRDWQRSVEHKRAYGGLLLLSGMFVRA